MCSNDRPREELKESPYWEEPPEVKEQMEHFADLEMGWGTHDWEFWFAPIEES